MNSIYLALRDVVGHPREVRATGGFTRSPMWVQILADVFGQRLRLPVVQEASSFGAAYLAMMGLGLARGIDDITELVTIEGETMPDAANHERYAGLYDLYMRLYWLLQEPFSEIAGIQRGEAPSRSAGQTAR
jgi:gluconokinase